MIVPFLPESPRRPGAERTRGRSVEWAGSLFVPGVERDPLRLGLPRASVQVHECGHGCPEVRGLDRRLCREQRMVGVLVSGAVLEIGEHGRRVCRGRNFGAAGGMVAVCTAAATVCESGPACWIAAIRTHCRPMTSARPKLGILLFGSRRMTRDHMATPTSRMKVAEMIEDEGDSW